MKGLFERLEKHMPEHLSASLDGILAAHHTRVKMGVCRLLDVIDEKDAVIAQRNAEIARLQSELVTQSQLSSADWGASPCESVMLIEVRNKTL